jgi:hypothetical protein
MPSRTTIVIATVVALTAMATLYVYWTRTPQYTLLQVLNAYAKTDHAAAAVHIEKEPPLKKKLRVKRRTENLIQHLTGLQNDTIARVYHVTVEASRIEGNTAALRVKLGETAYQLSFEEQRDGRWKLMDVEGLAELSTSVVRKTHHQLSLIMAAL